MSVSNIEIEVALLDSEVSERKRPIVGKYRPNFRFQDGRYDSVQFEIPDGEEIYPGQRRVLEISIRDPGDLADRLRPGVYWDVCEGAHVVGRATFLRVTSASTGTSSDS